MDKLQIKTDIHSHLLPGLDDGARNMEQTLLMLEGMQQAGFEHLYFSPHVSANRYPNTKSAIESRFREVKEACREKGIALEPGLCAEYYIDREFMEMAESGEPLLTLPGNHILVETSMMQEPLYLSDALFSLQSKGYTPILAHPERYPYYEENSDILLKLHHSGCLFQANLRKIRIFYLNCIIAGACSRPIFSRSADITGRAPGKKQNPCSKAA